MRPPDVFIPGRLACAPCRAERPSGKPCALPLQHRPVDRGVKQDRVLKCSGMNTPDLRVLYIENREMGIISWFTKMIRETALSDRSTYLLYSCYVCPFILTRTPG